MSTNLRRSDRMRRVVVQLLSGLGLIALHLGISGYVGTWGLKKVFFSGHRAPLEAMLKGGRFRVPGMSEVPVGGLKRGRGLVYCRQG